MNQPHDRPLAEAPSCSVLLALLALLSTACATVVPTPVGKIPPASETHGYKALFRGESDTPEGKGRFRLAVILAPPDRLRLEVYGPAGGPRLVAAASGALFLAMLPAERAYDRVEASAEEMNRILGVPLDGAGLISLLTARPPCPPEAARFEVVTKTAVALGRTVAWYNVSCPSGETRFQGQAKERGGSLLRATVREGISDAIMLQIEYSDFEVETGRSWPRRIRVLLPPQGAAITLTAAEGPYAGDIQEGIFEPQVPDGFERRTLAAPLTVPGGSRPTALPER